MRKLIAKFEVRLPNRFLVNRSENDALCYQAQIEDFDISISLIPEKGWQAKFANEKHYSFGISKALVSVGHDEPVKPPPVRTTEKGGKDYTVQEKYFSERLPKYRKIAATGLNRVIRFFKYRLRNPLLQELSPHNQDYQNPEWTD